MSDKTSGFTGTEIRRFLSKLTPIDIVSNVGKNDKVQCKHRWTMEIIETKYGDKTQAACELCNRILSEAEIMLILDSGGYPIQELLDTRHI